MATTVVTILDAVGGAAEITLGTSVGDHTRSVSVTATPQTGYVFDRWEIVITDAAATSGGGSASGSPREEGGGLGGSLPTDDGTRVDSPLDGPGSTF